MDVIHPSLELSSSRHLHQAAVRGQTRHPDVLDNYAGSSAGVVAASLHTDRLEATRQDIGAGRAKRKRTGLPDSTLDDERSIESMDEEELLKRWRLAGEVAGTSSGSRSGRTVKGVSLRT